MFYNFNKLVNESLSFYGFNNVNNGHKHRNEKGYTDEDPNYRRKHLNMVPDYVKKSQNTAVEKIRSLITLRQSYLRLSRLRWNVLRLTVPSPQNCLQSLFRASD